MTRRAHHWHTALVALVIALLGVALIYPIILTVRGGFAADIATGEDFTLRHVLLVFRDPVLLGGLLNSLKIAATTTVIAVCGDRVGAAKSAPLATACSRAAKSPSIRGMTASHSGSPKRTLYSISLGPSPVSIRPA